MESTAMTSFNLFYVNSDALRYFYIQKLLFCYVINSIGYTICYMFCE